MGEAFVEGNLAVIIKIKNEQNFRLSNPIS